MNRPSVVAGIVVLVASVSCATSKLSTSPSQTPSHSVKSIAMAPSGGLIADAIAVELFNRGFHVIDTAETSNLLVRMGLSEIEVTTPENLARLRDQGVDAYLVARSAAAADGRPQSASVRVNSTHTGAILAGVTWQNGWGGIAGSPADRVMRKDLTEAAVEIAIDLAKRLNAPGSSLP